MPVVGSGNGDRVDGFVFEQLAIIDVDLGFGQIPLIHVGQPLANHVFINVANGGDLRVGDGGESLDVGEPLPADADHANPDAVVGSPHFPRLREKADAA